MSSTIADLDFTARTILAFIERIDSLGAKEIDLRSLSVTVSPCITIIMYYISVL